MPIFTGTRRFYANLGFFLLAFVWVSTMSGPARAADAGLDGEWEVLGFGDILSIDGEKGTMVHNGVPEPVQVTRKGGNLWQVDLDNGKMGYRIGLVGSEVMTFSVLDEDEAPFENDDAATYLMVAYAVRKGTTAPQELIRGRWRYVSDRIQGEYDFDQKIFIAVNGQIIGKFSYTLDAPALLVVVDGHLPVHQAFARISQDCLVTGYAAGNRPDGPPSEDAPYTLLRRVEGPY